MAQIFEDDILVTLFHEFGTRQTYDQFYEHCVQGLLSWTEPKLGWMFDSNKVRAHFLKKFNQPELKPMESTFNATFELQGGLRKENFIYNKYSTATLKLAKIKTEDYAPGANNGLMQLFCADLPLTDQSEN